MDTFSFLHQHCKVFSLTKIVVIVVVQEKHTPYFTHGLHVLMSLFLFSKVRRNPSGNGEGIYLETGEKRRATANWGWGEERRSRRRKKVENWKKRVAPLLLPSIYEVFLPLRVCAFHRVAHVPFVLFTPNSLLVDSENIENTRRPSDWQSLWALVVVVSSFLLFYKDIVGLRR